MKQYQIILAVLASVSLFSCVSTKKYKASQAAYAALQTRYATVDGNLNDCNTKTGILESEKAALNTRISDLNAQVDYLKANNNQALKQLQNEVIAEVADALGNTPAVCRKAYIDPCVFDGWREGSLQRAANGARGERQWEQAALKFLSRAHRAQARDERKRTS